MRPQGKTFFLNWDSLHTPYKTEQPLQDMELQEKGAQITKGAEIFLETTYN